MSGGNVPIETSIVFFVFCCLFLGGVFRTMKSKFHFSYTPWLLLAGILITFFADDRPMLAAGYKKFLTINPHGMLAIFVPIIIFEPAFAANYHMFVQILPQVLILAGPVLFITTGLSAWAFQVLIGYEAGITWSGALTLGVLVSITDPVECVARLNYKKASHKFTTMIELESLANDGTGIILFNIFSQMAKIKHTPDLEAKFLLTILFQQGLGGLVLGWLFSSVSRFWLQYIYNDTVNIINVMVVASYILFYVAENTALMVSGILALCALGLGLSKTSETMIDHSTSQALHGFLKYALFMMETLIFMGIGIFIGYELGHDNQFFSRIDYLYLFLFFVATVVARFIAIGLFFYPLQNTGYGLDWKKYIILSFGGLRGSHSLILAMALNHTTAYDQKLTKMIITYMGGMVICSLIIQAQCFNWLVDVCKFVQTNPLKQRLRNQFRQQLVLIYDQREKQLKAKKDYTSVDWPAVHKLCHIEKQIAKIEKEEAKDQEVMDATMQDQIQYYKTHPEAIKKEFRINVLGSCKVKVVQALEEQYISVPAYNTLIDVLDIEIDHINHTGVCSDLDGKLEIWQHVKIQFMNTSKLSLFVTLAKIPIFGKLIRQIINDQLSHMYELVITTIEILSSVEAELNVGKLPEERLENFKQQILKEVQDNKFEAQVYLTQTQRQYKGIVKNIQTKRAARTIIRAFKTSLSNKENKSLLSNADIQAITDQFDKNLKQIDNSYDDWEIPDNIALLMNLPVFGRLTDHEINELQKHSENLDVESGKTIQDEGKPIKGLYFITSGAVEENYKNGRKEYHNAGELLNLCPKMLNKDAQTRLVARTDCELILFKAEDVQKMLDTEGNTQFVGDLYKTAVSSIIYVYDSNFTNLQHFTKGEIDEMMLETDYHVFQEGEKNYTDSSAESYSHLGDLGHGGFLFWGKLKFTDPTGKTQPRVQSAVSYIEPTAPGVHIEVLETARMLIFPNKLEMLLQNAVKSIITRDNCLEDGRGRQGSILNRFSEQGQVTKRFNEVKTLRTGKRQAKQQKVQAPKKKQAQFIQMNNQKMTGIELTSPNVAKPQFGDKNSGDDEPSEMHMEQKEKDIEQDHISEDVNI